MINKKILKTLIGLSLILICSCAKEYDYSRIKVVNVIDGDTVRLENGQSLRYIGIDTPEIKIKQNGRFSYKPQPFAIDAKKLNEKLVKNKFVRVEFDVEKTDKYKRLLGYCFIANTLINAKLVEEGFATTYTYPPNVKYTDILISAQKTARKNKKGMWGVYQTINSENAINHLNQIRTVKGTITSSKRTKKGLFLIMPGQGKVPFKIVIFNNALKYFHNKNIDPVSFYKGKTVEISGRIRVYNKSAQIIVSAPEEISIVGAE